ncbi:prepilin-type N-terminal cleavage/methylation domain-containing protein [Leisingera sp. MMG026]|uniref:prepilin-type N-terminal cleavage/methylation domain-containing protein n=1 Tax=Leisingera sp. MMG026 TaxID=2909982 RepID=UPI001F39E94D|nr:prepilin-type N-terminal cleavage/methylation domain-containing protein [Leisingera sp. MMG026]MCF6430541.1 prepilin-type N-terminal cleavage/methylation domain-containing protein [Leisingera sp. MMG026]
MDPAIEPVSPVSTAAGFTLIELLISVAILSVLATAAVLALGGGPDRSSRDLALFRSQYGAARALAIASGQSRGLVLTPQGLRLARRDTDGWDISERLQPWQGKVALSARRPAAGTPGIILLANGSSSAFSIAFGSAARCRSNGWEALACREN